MKTLTLLAALAAMVALADDDEFLIKPTAAGEPSVKAEQPETQPARAARPKKERLRKCYKCLGKGKQTVNVREPCERCEGTGYIEVEVEVKDTINGTYIWHANPRVTRRVQTKKPCPQCNHRGMLPVKKEVDCPKCKGSGFLTKDGSPAPVEPEVDDVKMPVAETARESREPQKALSLADRIRAGKSAKLRAFEISVDSDRGWAEFDFGANGGRFTVRNRETEFVTRWTGRGAAAVCAYKDTVDMIGYKPGPRPLPAEKNELESFDWSHPSVVAHVGETIAFMNKEGRFLVVKVMKVSNRASGADADLLQIEFRFY